MAKRAAAVPGQAPGAFFVDQTCIDCGTCYTFAPDAFESAGTTSRVARQPDGPEATRRAAMALLACPTGSIGSDDKAAVLAATSAFPTPIDGDVHFCGYTSERSFGAWSYFLQRKGGNLLVDSPRSAPPLMARIEALGGVSSMVLSHRDDVADHAQFHARFGCTRIAHAREGLAWAEQQVEGDAPHPLADDLLLIPTPGHTAGSLCLLYQDTYLFTGDHLWWNPRLARLSASKTYNWFSWETQLQSLERLLDFPFRWVLPGHGASREFATTAHAHAALEQALGELKRL